VPACRLSRWVMPSQQRRGVPSTVSMAAFPGGGRSPLLHQVIPAGATAERYPLRSMCPFLKEFVKQKRHPSGVAPYR